MFREFKVRKKEKGDYIFFYGRKKFIFRVEIFEIYKIRFRFKGNLMSLCIIFGYFIFVIEIWD